MPWSIVSIQIARRRERTDRAEIRGRTSNEHLRNLHQQRFWNKANPVGKLQRRLHRE